MVGSFVRCFCLNQPPLMKDLVAFQVGDSLGNKIQDSCSTVGAEVDDSPDSEYMVTATAMFELYMALQEFIKFKDNLPGE